MLVTVLRRAIAGREDVRVRRRAQVVVDADEAALVAREPRRGEPGRRRRRRRAHDRVGGHLARRLRATPLAHRSARRACRGARRRPPPSACRTARRFAAAGRFDRSVTSARPGMRATPSLRRRWCIASSTSTPPAPPPTTTMRNARPARASSRHASQRARNASTGFTPIACSRAPGIDMSGCEPTSSETKSNARRSPPAVRRDACRSGRARRRSRARTGRARTAPAARGRCAPRRACSGRRRGPGSMPE